MSEQFVYLIESILEIDKIEIEREREGGETRKLKQLKVCYNCWMEKSRNETAGNDTAQLCVTTSGAEWAPLSRYGQRLPSSWLSSSLGRVHISIMDGR